ncbi:hypothetical protein [uncultured Duncaniella sp.]|uniref:hypothetical protein n=1 Tax=uncultured Duncaniella sp. TaxID=2768039 RepID=UPI002732E9A0|nr:hypothetical protein [uncultured Duncaniella sp.]
MLETHPFPPYLPSGAKVLIMGTFPPQPHRWAMEFYYPNRTNDFWKIMGLIFFNDPTYLYDTRSRSFRLDLIKDLLDDKGIALHDTGREIRRLRDNASDKYLEIVTPVPLFDLLARILLCRTIDHRHRNTQNGAYGHRHGTKPRHMAYAINLPRLPSPPRKQSRLLRHPLQRRRNRAVTS